MRSGGTVTLLFTDLVGSTELLGRLGDEAAEGIRRIHFRLLRDAVVARGGEEVKNLGDGLMVVFDSAVDAVSCAAVMQQSVQRHNARVPGTRIDVRIGLHVGEPIRDEGDFFGTAVVVAKRLCDGAAGGQVLASHVVRDLVGSRENLRFGSALEVVLKGLDAPLTAFELLWEPPASPPVPLPLALASRSRLEFVGRDVELARLSQVWERVKRGQRRLVVVSGDAGIGKSRLAGEFCRLIHGHGGGVMFGRCDEETLIPYQPFVEALSHYVATCPLDELGSQVDADRGELQELVPGLLARLPGLSRALAGNPEGERYRLFESVASFLAEASSPKRPLVFVIDDAHWADRPSLLLLKHIMRSASQSALLILATCRDSELVAGHPLAELLADLRRDDLVDSVFLSGLDESGVGALIGAWGGHEPPSAFAHAVAEETEGNPFFVQEVLRHLAEAGVIFEQAGRWNSHLSIAEMGIPQGVRDVIGRRLSRLSPLSRRSLSLASMLGRDFGLDLLCAVGALDRDDTLEALDEALVAHLVEEEVGTVGQYRFAHALIRETLYHELSATRRARQHHLIGERLEIHYGDQAGEHATELARHFIHATAVGGTERAVYYSTLAGQEAAGKLAHEEAASHYQQALDLGNPDGSERCELLLALGEAQWRSGDLVHAKITFNEMADLAWRLGEAELLARAALGCGLGMGGAGFSVGRDEALIALLEQALAALSEQDSSMRVRLLSRLAVELYFTASIETFDRRAQLSLEAIEMAGRLGDRAARLVALYSRHWSLLGPDFEVDARLAIGEEMITLATEVGDREMTYRGHHIRLRTLLDIGDVTGVAGEVKACEDLAHELREPFFVWQPHVLRATIALHEGRLDDAERITQEALQLGQGRVDPNLLRTATSAAVVVRRLFIGEAATVIGPIREFIVAQPWMPIWTWVLPWTCFEAGRMDDARESFDRAVTRDPSHYPRDGNWLLGVGFLSMACVPLGEAAVAADLYDLLAPYAGRIMTTGTGSFTFQSVDTALAMLCVVTGRERDARDHFEAALVAPESRPASVATRREYAHALLAHDSAENRRRAAEVIRQGIERAEQIGMPTYLAQLQDLASRLDNAQRVTRE